jgi:hypothetical protein
MEHLNWEGLLTNDKNDAYNKGHKWVHVQVLLKRVLYFLPCIVIQK